jgi:hypothetical protein
MLPGALAGLADWAGGAKSMAVEFEVTGYSTTASRELSSAVITSFQKGTPPIAVRELRKTSFQASDMDQELRHGHSRGSFSKIQLPFPSPQEALRLAILADR